MKKALLLVVLISTIGWMVGCASSKSLDGFNRGGSGGGAGFQSGNWAFTTSGVNGTLTMGGALTASGSTVTGNLIVVGGSSFAIGPSVAPMPVSGILSSGTLTLTGVINSSNFSITFTGVPTSGTVSSLPTGTFTVTGGPDDGDHGPISGALAGNFDGTWQGSDSTTGGTMTVAVTEATSPSTTGTYGLTPAGSGVTFTGGATGCTVTGTLQPDSFVAGGIMVLDITTVDNGVNGQLLFAGGASNPATPTSITVGPSFYIYNGGSGCMLQNTNNQIAFGLTKQ
jgi:hypothetical protein